MHRGRDVLVKEYRNAWGFGRDVQRHLEEGWQIESTLERKPSRDLLHIMTFGLASRIRGPERLVTFTRTVPDVGQTVQPALQRAAQPVVVPAPGLAFQETGRAVRPRSPLLPVGANVVAGG